MEKHTEMLSAIELKKAESASKLTNLGICRSLEANAAMLYGANSETGKETPVIVHESTYLGVKGQEGASEKESVQHNPQLSEQAFLQPDEDTLVYRYTVRANGKNDLPIEACSSQRMTLHLGGLFQAYTQAGGAEYLGTLFAANIADARPAFRNRAFTSAVTTVKAHCAKTGEEKIFNFETAAADKPRLNPMEPKNPVIDPEAIALGQWIGKGLAGEDLVLLTVESRLVIGYGQEVYPSQEMVSDRRERSASRVYYKDENTNQAKVHSQKIGHGIRSIDIWHPAVDLYGAIAAEPYGNYPRKAVSVRYEDNFYDTLKSEFKAVVKDKNAPQITAFAEQVLSAQSLDDLHAIPKAHFFFAILMRGGVFGEKSK